MVFHKKGSSLHCMQWKSVLDSVTGVPVEVSHLWQLGWSFVSLSETPEHIQSCKHFLFIPTAYFALFHSNFPPLSGWTCIVHTLSNTIYVIIHWPTWTYVIQYLSHKYYMPLHMHRIWEACDIQLSGDMKHMWVWFATLLFQLYTVATLTKLHQCKTVVLKWRIKPICLSI